MSELSQSSSAAQAGSKTEPFQPNLQRERPHRLVTNLLRPYWRVLVLAGVLGSSALGAVAASRFVSGADLGLDLGQQMYVGANTYTAEVTGHGHVLARAELLQDTNFAPPISEDDLARLGILITKPGTEPESFEGWQGTVTVNGVGRLSAHAGRKQNAAGVIWTSVGFGLP